MNLTQAEIDAVAAKAQWYFDVSFPQTQIPGDSVVITGDGVDDLTRLQDLLTAFPNANVSLDVGTFTSSFKAVGLADVAAIKTAYITAYGTVNKPPLLDYESSAIQT